MYASDNGNAKIAEQLLARGADPNESAKASCLNECFRLLNDFQFLE